MATASPLLRRIRQRTGEKPGAFARSIRVTPCHLSNVEAQRRPVSHEALARAAARLNVPVEVLIDGTPEAKEYAAWLDGTPVAPSGPAA